MESDRVKEALAGRLLAMGDDELILGHRNSEWCGHAPILEEDIAFANLALDEIGHAVQWYSLLAGVIGEDPNLYPDQAVYFRPAQAFRNMQMLELPKGDWAFSLLRQYLFDAAERLMLSRLVDSTYAPLAAAAEKIRKEEVYHYRHSQAWITRLGLGTEESRSRLQAALGLIWPYTGQVFASQPGDTRLEQEGIFPPALEMQDSWEAAVRPFLRECGLNVPDIGRSGFERTEHTPHLETLLHEMQSVARMEPGAGW